MKRLNPPQQQAVNHTEGALLILAGAGSGKTQVVTTRIVHLLKGKHVPAENILAVTFTNKAAKEMRERVAGMAGSMADGIVISTFHSLGIRILRRDIKVLGFKPNFSIYTESDQDGVIRQAMRECNIDPKQIKTSLIQWKISGLKNQLVTPDKFVPTPGDMLGLATRVVYTRYQELLKGFNAIDFDDIIMFAVDLIKLHPVILAYWQERFKYIMVDEYQDTNASQYQMIALLAKCHGNICVVGDDDQSIYGWRGADIQNILNFGQNYPGCTTIKLEQNYRSTGSILDAANSVIRNNPLRTDKALWTASGQGREIDLIVANDEEEEATKIVEGMLIEHFQDRLSWSDFAILYRSNFQSVSFEKKLQREGIPYVVVGGQKFFERKEVKDTIAYLRVIDNPLDEASLLRIINFPRRGIGDTTLVRLNQWSLKHNVPLFEALRQTEEITGMSESTRKTVATFHNLLQGVIDEFDAGHGLGKQVNVLFNRLRIDDEIHRTADDSTQARKRIENIEQIVNELAIFEEQNPREGLSGFLERISLMDNQDGEDSKEHGRNAVTLMSLHSSKGLEFNNVNLVGMEEELLPHKRSIEEDPTCAEERRLCYVGITRARRHLTISRCLNRRKYGEIEKREPSRFLAEIPENLFNDTSSDAISNESKSADLAQSFFSQEWGI